MMISAFTVTVGGVLVSYAEAGTALECLLGSPGLMVRQPLQRLGSPLAGCDYHAAAAPFLEAARSALGLPSGRGAAGRPSTKAAFMQALALVLEQARLEARAAWLRECISAAREAFSTDHSYAAAIATTAVALRRKRHVSGLRSLLRSASAEAITACSAVSGGSCQSLTPCGTGTCVFAAGVLREITTPSLEGRSRRPQRHEGSVAFSADDALPELERLVPLVLGRPVRDADSARATEAVLSVGV